MLIWDDRDVNCSPCIQGVFLYQCDRQLMVPCCRLRRCTQRSGQTCPKRLLSVPCDKQIQHRVDSGVSWVCTSIGSQGSHLAGGLTLCTDCPADVSDVHHVEDPGQPVHVPLQGVRSPPVVWPHPDERGSLPTLTDRNIGSHTCK